ncbi:MAG: Stk1 family PASTA domain-containing Ser/Thr kinase [Bifidobacteriaceae bacterium]|jgi:serine/threonine-protein kinase|nr:Stk1 family PASTA domain-containing Ser/Thr kinase [Bifidobacteriaceae bacterium]
MSSNAEVFQKVLDNRYKIIEKIATGGMAAVYRAHDQKLERDVAVKILHKHLLTDESGKNFEQRFIKEAKAAASLIHPNIVGVYDQGSDGDDIYLVMELVKGRTLRNLLNEKGKLDVKTSFAIVKSVLEGLQAAHKKNMVHRDIKPENVIIQDNGVVKLTDFGLARVMSDSHSTATNTALGTVAYMSPELVEAGQSVLASDIYSVGIMLFEMLIGKTPYQESTPLQIALDHVKKSVPRLLDLDSSIPAPVSGLVEVFTIKDCENRPPDAHTALELLDKAVDAMNSIPEMDSTQVLDLDPTKTIMMSLGDMKTKGTKKSKDKKRASKKQKKFYIVLACILALALAVGSFFVWNYLGPGAYKTIPGDLIGKTYDEASLELQALGIKVDRAEDYSDKIEVGKIMQVKPDENTSIRFRDETAILTVSKGIKYIDFPQTVKDKKTSDLVSELTSLGFTNIVVENDYSVKVKKDFLIKSSVKDGTRLRWDAKIVLTNSKGPKPITYPDVIGQNVATAKAALQAMGVTVKIKTQFSDTVETDLVISQNPAGAAKGFEGETITLIVSAGPPITTVPNVVGLSVKDAHNKLSAANLKWSDSGSAVLGLIQKQSISAGKQIAVNTVIILTIV